MSIDRFIRLGDVAEFRNGLNFSKESRGIGCTLIGVPEFQDRFTPDYSSLPQINPSGIAADEDYLKKHDIVFVRSNGNKALVGRSLYIDKEVKALFSGFCIRARIVGTDLDPKYFAYFTRSKHFKKSIAASAGTNINNLNQNILKDVSVPWFKNEQQLAIAKVLSTLDAKIDLNNRINEELEGLAKLLYDYWFVQFDFPISADQAAAMGDPTLEGKPYRQSGGKMVYNKTLKREIPEGWEAIELHHCVERILDHRGKTPKKLGGDWSTEADAIIALSAKVVKGGKLVGLENANRVDRDLFDKWMPHKLMDGDILMTSEAPAGEFYFIYGKTDYCLSQRLFALRADTSVVQPSYLYYELSKGHAYHQILGSLSGSTVFGIRQDVLRTIKVVVPSMNVQQAFEEATLPLLRQIKLHDEQNQQLTELRDWLLPMLMNGQVTVAES